MSSDSSKLVIHNLPLWNPCSLADINSDSFPLILLRTQRSITLETIPCKEIRQHFSKYAFSFFLWTGTMFASSTHLEYDPRDLLNNMVKDGTMMGAAD